MDWQNILESRHQCFIFEENKPDISVIQGIVDDLHTKCPSKQNRVVYNLHIFDWSNKELRMDIYKGTERDPENHPGVYNPQTLAPYLFVWSPRQIEQQKNIHAEGILNPEYNDEITFNQQVHMEVGISSMFVVLSAINRGLSAGFCKCIHNHEELKHKYGFTPTLYLGVGYKKDSIKYFCPVNQREWPAPLNTWYPKPAVDQYVRYSV